MYRVDENYFESDNDDTAIYQYASYINVSNTNHPLIKIENDEEVILCTKNDTQKLRKQMNKFDKIVLKEIGAITCQLKK